MKTTFRIPDPLLQELRVRSLQEGRSLNATAIDVLRHGLGHAQVDQEVSEVLGSFVARQATIHFEPAVVVEEVVPLAVGTLGLGDALDWTRDEP
ncbi:MAG: hypothetical protein ACR2PL_19765 [Dehalococcoidia bacterium]